MTSAKNGVGTSVLATRNKARERLTKKSSREQQRSRNRRKGRKKLACCPLVQRALPSSKFPFLEKTASGPGTASRTCPAVLPKLKTGETQTSHVEMNRDRRETKTMDIS